MEYGLTSEQLNAINGVLSNNAKITEAVIFGSRAKGNYKPGSDIDLCIIGNDLELKDILNIQNSLDDLNLPYFFDVVIHARISEPALLEHIARVGKTIYRAIPTA